MDFIFVHEYVNGHWAVRLMFSLHLVKISYKIEMNAGYGHIAV